MSTTAETLFALLTTATAPAASSPMLAKVQESLGFIPNLMATLANNPTILLTVSLENNCNYCAAEHSAIAKGMFTRRLNLWKPFTAIRRFQMPSSMPS